MARQAGLAGLRGLLDVLADPGRPLSVRQEAAWMVAQLAPIDADLTAALIAVLFPPGRGGPFEPVVERRVGLFLNSDE